MKNFTLLSLLLVLFTLPVMAQKTVTGTVIGKDGTALIGVNVIEEGTTNGMITDIDGQYSIEVADGATLEFSMIGYTTQTVSVGSQTTINVTLEEGVALDEVVVTALGVSREKKALSYSVTELQSENISTIKDHNAANSLIGKVPGVVVSPGANGPGTGSRIVIRGNNSITGNNQPLIVVDGVPIDAGGSNSGGSVFNSGVTGGGITDVNPDDIESISVLKGPNAAALYGSRASNGVLLITTKSGTVRKGIGVSINSNITFDNPMFLPDYQNQYGQGTQGNVPANVTELKQASGSWGPRLDGSPQLYYTGETRPYSAQPNNVEDFFRTAGKFINTIALDGGSKDFNARLSYTNNQTESILPNSDLEAHNFTLRTQAQLSERLSFDAKATFFTQELRNRATLGGEGILNSVYFMPRNVAISDLETFQIPEESLNSVSYSALGANPYWMLNNDRWEEDRSRFLSFAKVTYDFTDWLSAFVRIGSDITGIRTESVNQPGHHFFTTGRLNFSESDRRETNVDFLVMVNKDLNEDFNLSLNVGGNHSYRTNQGSGIFAEEFRIPTRAFVNNASVILPSYTPFTEHEINSVYASASLSYQGWAYLDFSGRNDWSSTLPLANNSYFYPSVGLSMLLNRFIDPNQKVFNLFKVRSNWAQVGNDTSPFQTNEFFTVAQEGYLGTTNLGRPSVRPNANLQPETITSFEFGVEGAMFDNRLFFDFSVYNITSEDLIFDVPVPAATGFNFFRENVGELTNRGVELLIGYTPVRTENFNWEVSLNYFANENELVELIDDLDSYTLNQTNSGNVAIQGTVGGGYGDIFGNTWRTNDAGQRIVNAEGFPLASTDRVLLGNNQPDWVAGLTNTLRYKDLSLRFLIDGRFGGQVYSSVGASLDGSGVSEESLEFREGGIVFDGVIEQEDGTFVQNTINISAQDYWGSHSGIASNYIFDQDNIRLRELALGYTLPSSFTDRTFINKATISLIGRNLFFISKDVPHVDPEASLGTGNNGQGILINPLPTLRSLGFNISVQF